jgi:hypothetical protein
MQIFEIMAIAYIVLEVPLDPPDIKHAVSRTFQRAWNGQKVVFSDDLPNSVGIQPPPQCDLRLRMRRVNFHSGAFCVTARAVINAARSRSNPYRVGHDELGSIGSERPMTGLFIGSGIMTGWHCHRAQNLSWYMFFDA